jgi:hypothetical protein
MYTKPTQMYDKWKLRTIEPDHFCEAIHAA